MTSASQGALSVLDCTLRDGGYYCDWDFDDDMVRRYLDGIVASGIRLVEMGFRSRSSRGFAGKYKFCPDALIADCLPDGMRVAVMIDGKDFVQKGKEIAEDRLLDLFAPKPESRVDIVRITATEAIVPGVAEIARVLRHLGYTVSVNLMQASVLTDAAIGAVAGALDDSPVDILYIADSFGGLTPSRTSRLFALHMKNFSRDLGFHGHDNLGLALANSIAAVDSGATLVDCSLLGMGRGAGNLRTEQLLLYLRFQLQRTDLDVAPLFEIVSTDFAKLQDRYGWGASLPYMLSAVYDLHPTYAQKLLQGGRYSSMEVIRTLEALHRKGAGTGFRSEELALALQDRFAELASPCRVVDLPGYRSGLPIGQAAPSRPVLLLASGPSIRRHAAAINDFIRRRNPIVIECNAHELIDAGPDHCCIFTNHQRLEQFGPIVSRTRGKVVLGMPVIERAIMGYLDGKAVHAYPCTVRDGAFEANSEGCLIPYDVVTMAALALALQTNPKTVFLCGVDGYSEAEPGEDTLSLAERMMMNREMEAFFRLARSSQGLAGTELISLTPTAFDIHTESIYAYL